MYDRRVGASRPEREEPLARATYIAAVRRFSAAFAGFVAIGVPLDPGPAGQPAREWTRRDVEVLRELHAATAQVLSTRRAYDAVRRRR